jgi:hypothetical protein
MFEDSKMTKVSLDYFTKVFGQYLSPVGLMKVITINSAKCPYPRPPLIQVAPSREFKSKLTEKALRFFNRNRYLDLSGDETIHGLKNSYGKPFSHSKKFETLVILHGRCLCVDEGNLLLRAMSGRGKIRWLSACSQLYSKERYDYVSELGSFRVVGRITLIINITTDLYAKAENVLRDTTLGQRSLTVFTWLKDSEKVHVRENFRKFKKLKPEITLSEPYDRAIKNLGEYRGELTGLAKDYAVLGVRNLSETLEVTEGMATQNARLNQRNRLCKDDIDVIRMLRGYTINPRRKNFVRVVGFLKEGRSYSDIIHLLRKPRSYYSTISRWKKIAQNRGLLDQGVERPEWWKELS